MQELCTLADLSDFHAAEMYLKNQQLFLNSSLQTDLAVQKQVANLKEADFTRRMPRRERQALQRKHLHLPLLPTTTIGSFPQTKEVKQNRSKYRRGEISEEQYRENAKKFICDCIQLQEEIVLVHGEFERNDMVEFFGENLTGYVFTENAWVQSYGTCGLKPPIIFGDIKREKSITTDYIRYANSLTDKDVKGICGNEKNMSV